MFIKRGDGKILEVIKSEDVKVEDQVKDASNEDNKDNKQLKDKKSN